MGWQLLGDVAVGWQWADINVRIEGDVALKLEHSYSYASFPGKAYAILSSTNEAGDRALYHRSYPSGDADIIASEVPAVLVPVGFDRRYLSIKRNLFARVQDDANWRVKVYRWAEDD